MLSSWDFTKWPLIPGGLGVTIFFAISGFLITWLLLAEFDRKGTFDLAAFYQRRAWRLLPAILASIVGTFAVGAALISTGSPGSAQPPRSCSSKTMGVCMSPSTAR